MTWWSHSFSPQRLAIMARADEVAKAQGRKVVARVARDTGRRPSQAYSAPTTGDPRADKWTRSIYHGLTGAYCLLR